MDNNLSGSIFKYNNIAKVCCIQCVFAVFCVGPMFSFNANKVDMVNQQTTYVHKINIIIEVIIVANML